MGTEAARKIAFDFQNAWDYKFTSAQQSKVHQIALHMEKRGFSFYPVFYHYFAYLAYSVAQENLQRDELTNLLKINERVVHTFSEEEYSEFVFGLNIYLARRYLSLKKNLTVQAVGGTYSFQWLGGSESISGHSELTGPAIEIKDAKLLIITPYETLEISHVYGTFLLQNRTLVATQGTLKWPEENHRFRGAIVQLGEFYLKKDRADFQTTEARLIFGALFQGEVEGDFAFKSIRKQKGQPGKYPVFTSKENHVDVTLAADRVAYTGGIGLRGNDLYGRAVSKKLGTLTLFGNSGNRVTLKSTSYALGNTLFSTEKSAITVYHGRDSLTHKDVKARYDIPSRTLTVLRNNTLTPFFSSYFDVIMNVDLLEWNMEQDILPMRVFSAQDLIPATFESKDFFNPSRFKKLARFLNFHPIVSAVYYSRKYGIGEFYTHDLATEFNIDEKSARAAASVLGQYGFADYDAKTGRIKLYERAFHYYDASGELIDYDNFMVPSKISDGPNAYLQLDSGALTVRGVSRFYVTTDFKVYGVPYDGEVTLLEGRNMKFDGVVHAGDLDFQGQNHKLDYETFLFEMAQVDSIQMSVPLKDTVQAGAGFRKTRLENQLTSTSGTLYIDKGSNKSEREENPGYPLFRSNSDAIIYFDGPEILGGAYDKSVYFTALPFKMDSVERADRESIRFEGTFHSESIFPVFHEVLSVQEDQSLGFKHKIPDSGYHLYGTQAKTYEEISLSNQGIRGYGQIDFLSTTIYSDDFIYYPDSVTTNGTSGVISPGTIEGVSYPEVVLGPYLMSWLPRKDNMRLRNVGETFKFYNSTAELDGEATITSQGVFGSGTMITRGSRSVSENLTFREFECNARHASFEVLTRDSDKPAMAGEDIYLNFDLVNNTAIIRPERRGIAAISFPYAQMKTSITEAVWDLENSVVTMTKPPEVPIKDSYFFSTLEALDSLAFNAEKAIYDINTQELKVEGIPYITIADSRIIPENNETTILANSVLQTFKNAEIIIDTLHGYHYLDRASINVISSKKFEGNAYYRQIVGKDTFDIRFDSFELVDVPVGKSDKKRNNSTQTMTVSGGEVYENQNLIISPGFLYKGKVTMYAYKEALELDGFVKLDIEENNYWVHFRRTDEEPDVRLPFNNAKFEGGGRPRAGIHQDSESNIYATFVEEKQNDSDPDFFQAKGVLSYSDALRSYKIESPLKTTGESYEGSTMIYDHHAKSVVMEGPVNFFDPKTRDMTVEASALGSGNLLTSDYEIDAMLILDFKVATPILDMMAIELVATIERIGASPANDISIESMYKLANIVEDENAKLYETSSLKNYMPLVSVSLALEKPLVISGVTMKWAKDYKAWYSTSKQLSVSNIMQHDINAKMDGFLEIRKDETGADALTLFLQIAPGVWYFIAYSQGQLIMYSSHPDFNAAVDANSNIDIARPREMVFVRGDTNETLKFIHDFRLKYLGIEEPYPLVFPDNVNLEDESFDTIEDNDGFD